MFVVQEMVAGKWHTVRNSDNSADRTFASRDDAFSFTERLVGKTRILPVRNDKN